MPGEQTNIGDRIRMMRTAMRMSLDELGGTSRAISTLIAIEKGELEPTERFVSVIARRLNCPRDYLMEGVPDSIAKDIGAQFRQAESAVRSGAYAQGLAGFAALLQDPATILLPEFYDRSLLGYAYSQETAGRYHSALGVLTPLRHRRTPGDGLWVESSAAASRCFRLAGETTSALAMAEASVRECPIANYARFEYGVPLRVEHVAALAACGKHSRAKAAVGDLAQLAHIAEDPYLRVQACWAVSYAALARGDDSEAVRWAKGMYRVGTNHQLLPPFVLENRVADLLLSSNTPDAAKMVVEMMADRNVGDVSLEADTIRQINLTKAWIALGDLRQAADACRSIITNFRDLPGGLDGEVLMMIGDVEIAEERFGDAAEIFKQAAEEFDTAGLPVKAARAFHKAANALANDGRHAQAEKMYRYASRAICYPLNPVQYEPVPLASGRNSSSTRRA
jgi:tetratricopeptide (TPR) repeat protein